MKRAKKAMGMRTKGIKSKLESMPSASPVPSVASAGMAIMSEDIAAAGTATFLLSATMEILAALATVVLETSLDAAAEEDRETEDTNAIFGLGVEVAVECRNGRTITACLCQTIYLRSLQY